MLKEPKLVGENLLKRELAREFFRWNAGSYSYGITYFANRVILIIASAIVAGKETLQGGSVGWLLGWVPALAVLVAILTALDTWLKPADRWRGFLESRDKLADLLARYKEGVNADEVREEFDKIRARHREKNIF